MKLCTFRTADGAVRFGALAGETVIDLHRENPAIPGSCLEFVRDHEKLTPLAQACLAAPQNGWPLGEVALLPPLPDPPSFRDFMGFAEHHETCRKNRRQQVDPVYYQIPVFYFSNTLSLRGSGEPVRGPAATARMDFEFEIGFVIGRQGRDINPAEAADYIFGYTILNDWSARDLQMEEMRVGLGPAKGKDFATSLGPWLVTRDEWDPFRCGEGLRYDRATRLTLNGRVLRENNLRAITHDFAAMIARASAGVTLRPGELFGSGTVGGGCLLEYGGELPFLEPGDLVEMEVDGLGKLVCPVA